VLVTYTDPTPPSEKAVQAVKAAHAAAVNAYSREERKYHEETVEIPIHFWYDFTTLFRLYNLAYLSPSDAKGWRDLIDKKGIRITRGRGFPMIEAIKEVLTAVEFPGKDEPTSVTWRNIEDADASKMTSNERVGIGGEVEQDSLEKNYRSDLSSTNMGNLSKLIAGRESYEGSVGEDLQSVLSTYEAITSVAQCLEKHWRREQHESDFVP
jgi:hypothetical protein